GTIGALTSAREQREKARRSIGGKIERAKRGEYQGGYPPFGFDVVCFNDDKEKWRTVYYGHFDRAKVYPDGTREQFEGKDNAPRKDANDVLLYRPTIERDRIKVAKQVFAWYASESISPRQLATRLNELKVDPVFGELWDKVKILSMLRNPVYIGQPAWNKRAGSRFVEYVNGQIRDVAKVNGKAKLGRWRDRDNYVGSGEQFKPIIDAETWNKVQRKIADASDEQRAVKKRPAQTADLWLKPFLVCGQCGKPMRATRGGSTERLWPSYFCGTYGTYGPTNPTGCHCHRVQHAVIEKIVFDYLAQTAPKLAKLIAATKAGDLDAARPLLEAVTDASSAYYGVEVDMTAFVDEQLSDRDLKRLLKQGNSFPTIYGLLYERMRPGMERQIAAKERELDKQLDSFADLSGRLRDRAKAKMEDLQGTIDRLQAQLDDLRVPWTDLAKEMTARRRALKQAEQTLSNGATGRQKTEVLSGIVDRIVCHFRHTKTKQQANNGKSYLDRVEIEPVSGASVCFTDGKAPAPD
ncbi:MAG: recombinase family protein, partial [Pirellulales bacterium]